MRKMRRKQQGEKKWKITLVALIPVILIVFPIWYILIGSMMTTPQIFHQPPYLFPPHPKEAIENYSTAIKGIRNAFLNSIIITGGSMLVILILSTPAAFALAKLKLKFKKASSFTLQLIQMLPITSTIIPLYLLFQKINLLNSFIGVIVAISSFGIPFIIIMLIPYMNSFPTALMEAAEIEGASLWVIFTKIVIPLSRPALTTASLFAFLQGWNNFVFPLTLLQDDTLYPLSIRLFTFVGEFGTQWNYLMAGSMIYALPSIILILIGSKFLVTGLTAGAFKE
ncbi:binding-protein-dependent transport systems inner membrane component [Caldicellulosiruptor hydrothermalis 108]|uniref:Binding-protein-dependent transport systems inner membrane component n=1 Tax=Caldicellulosiruptor hydrothermalis (strain DSM 18901 / VKM B-2411 / 108) TaxID=632292 RepID=E4QDM1_CALH1|nr:carbohydrate ABC transporter permease [Caldicellulosiruptor hydrothermalis]ADQ06438.1 binding-protein-dependent transport systems inner membrane component [Caldicellulosiruptor hydrothermalis 108]